MSQVSLELTSYPGATEPRNAGNSATRKPTATLIEGAVEYFQPYRDLREAVIIRRGRPLPPGRYAPVSSANLIYEPASLHVTPERERVFSGIHYVDESKALRSDPP